MGIVDVVVFERQAIRPLAQLRCARARDESGCTRQGKNASGPLHCPTTMFSSNSKSLPQRTHSTNALKHADYFSPIDEELRDCKRVQHQGQEEDLREALSRMMARVEEMVRYRLDHTDALRFCARCPAD